MNDEEMLTRALKALAAEMEPLGAPDDVELKVLEAFRKQNTVRPFVPKRSNSRYWIAAAVAAMLLIAISVVAYRLNQRVDDGRKLAIQEQPQSSPKVIDEPVKQVAGVQEQEQKSLAQAPKPRRVRHSNVRQPENDRSKKQCGLRRAYPRKRVLQQSPEEQFFRYRDGKKYAEVRGRDDPHAFGKISR